MAATIDVNLFDGRGIEAVRQKPDVLLSVRDGSEKTFHRTFVRGPKIAVQTDFHDSPQDNYTVLASLKGHRDSGFAPIVVRAAGTTPVNLMLIPRRPEFEFAAFGSLAGKHEALFTLLSKSFGNDAQQQYGVLMARKLETACLMNIVEALAIIPLPQGQGVRPTVAHYIERLDLSPMLNWLRQDRFFAWCSADIGLIVRELTSLFKKAPKGLHPGAIASFKQFGFGEANVQVTLHENNASDPNLIKVEFDIDYFRDTGAHLLLEVFPNTLKRFVLETGSSESLTDPSVAYGLRWMAGRQPTAAPQVRPFSPAFTIKPVA